MKSIIVIPLLLLATGCSGFDVSFDPTTGRPTHVSIRGKDYSVATPVAGADPIEPGTSTVAIPSSGDQKFDNLLARTASCAARGDYEGARTAAIDTTDYAAARGHDAPAEGNRGATGASATAGAAPDPKAAAREATKQNARDALSKIGEDF